MINILGSIEKKNETSPCLKCEHSEKCEELRAARIKNDEVGIRGALNSNVDMTKDFQTR